MIVFDPHIKSIINSVKWVNYEGTTYMLGLEKQTRWEEKSDKMVKNRRAGLKNT